MSILGQIETAAETLAKDLIGGNVAPINADLKAFETAFSSTKKFAEDMKAGKATPEQGLAALDDQLKALAVVFPAAAAFEPYVETAETVAGVFDALGIIKTTPVNAPVFGGDAGPERVFGFTPDP
jgi:hypothetical protein